VVNGTSAACLRSLAATRVVVPATRSTTRSGLAHRSHKRAHIHRGHVTQHEYKLRHATQLHLGVRRRAVSRGAFAAAVLGRLQRRIGARRSVSSFVAVGAIHGGYGSKRNYCCDHRRAGR
jgi:hypothetical protein